ncbi:uncharacterized protein CIMG_06546 [Coccidioides immitis RS]|uniref:Uncharacterized protein n=1 Tax=Coccidioides immitis (strain RS) TaxID=246410 RepID=J3K8D2_COCIM|nr:uncharacterized protein CIMG_06546 [Coccidioides immitis RS]EAS31067.3 hypothetical protein CIMG_06546 [Coccidioides immitis RS]
MEHISTTALAITVPDEYSSGARGYALHMKDKKRSFKWGRQISLIILRTFNSRLGKPRPFCVPERALKVGEIAADSVVNTLMFYVVESANYLKYGGSVGSLQPHFQTPGRLFHFGTMDGYPWLACMTGIWKSLPTALSGNSTFY